MSDASPTRHSGLGLTRTNILGSGAVLNTPGSRKGIQGVSLTPARTVGSAGPSLSSVRTPRERYQSAYTSRLGSLALSAPNVSNLTVADSSGDGTSPRRANLSSLKLSPRRGSADPRLTKLELINDENSVEGRIDTPRRGSDVIGTSLQRKLNVEQAGYRRSPVSLTRTHSDIESERLYSQSIRNKASKTLATLSPRSPSSDFSGNGDSAKLDSGYNSPRNTEKFTYSGTSSPSSVLSSTSSDIPNYSESYHQSNVKETVSPTGVNLDTTDGGYEAVKGKEKTRYDSGYHSPRYETNVGAPPNKIISPQEESSERDNQAISKADLTRNSQASEASEKHLDKFNHKDAKRDFSGNDVHCKESLESSPKPQFVSRATNLEPTPEHSILATGLGSSPHKGTVSTSDMSASRKQPEKSVTIPLSPLAGVGDISTEVPTPQPRTRRRLTKRMSFKRVEDDEYIGFASLPEQVHRKAVRRGFEFTLMVVGETGLGKSTLINSLFLTDLYKDRKITNTEERIQKTVDLEKKELEIEERGVKLKLTIVDTPGFNDAVNSEESWKAITDYVDKQFEAYFKAESGLNRKNIKDTRVHCCLYFISPYGHGLRPVDILVMKKLHNKVNIVPLIAKSDMLTKQECKRLKDKILDEIERHRIRIYQFPDCDSDEDEEFKQQDKELKASIPFAVVGSNTVVEAGGKKIRGRMYPWGIVEVENPKHCDFIRLRQMLISTHMQDLKDVTCDIHYENYRAEHISEQMGTQHKERNKLKRDSTPNMEAVLETDLLLQQKEAEIQRMKEMMRQMEAKIRNQNSPQMNGRVGNV